MSVKSGKLLAAEDLLQSHICADRSLPKVGTKDFKPTNSWLEKKQIQAALEECKQLLEEERVEKLGALAEACWIKSKKLAEVTRKVGKHWQTMGFEQNGKLFLYAEEALHLLETNCLELIFDGVPMSIQQAYSILLSNGTGCTLSEYRTYAHLVRQGFRLLRHSKEDQPTNYEHRIRLDQHVIRKRARNIQKDSLCFNPLDPGRSTDSDPGTSHGSPRRNDDDGVRSRMESGSREKQNGRTGREVSQSQDQSESESESEGEMEGESSIHDVYSNNSDKKNRSEAEGSMSDFAQSIVNMGKSFIKTETKTDIEELGLDSLRRKILDMLENHFQGQISLEAMDAVSLSASRAILTHVSNEKSDGKDDASNDEAPVVGKSAETSDQMDVDEKPALPIVPHSADSISLSNGPQIELRTSADGATNVKEEPQETCIEKVTETQRPHETEETTVERLSEITDGEKTGRRTERFDCPGSEQSFEKTDSTVQEQSGLEGQSSEKPESVVQEEIKLVEPSEKRETAVEGESELVKQPSENPETAVEEESGLVKQRSDKPETAAEGESGLVEQPSEKPKTALEGESGLVEQSSEKPETAVEESGLVKQLSDKPETAAEGESGLVEQISEDPKTVVQEEIGRVEQPAEQPDTAVSKDSGLEKEPSEKSEAAVPEESERVKETSETSQTAIEEEARLTERSSEKSGETGLVKQSPESLTPECATGECDTPEEKNAEIGKDNEFRNLPLEQPTEISGSKSTECPNNEAPPTQQLVESSLSDISEIHPIEEPPRSVAQTEGETPRAERTPGRETASTETESLPSGKPSESVARDDSEILASQELPESDGVDKNKLRATEKSPDSAVQRETETVEKYPKDSEHEKISVENNCDIPLGDTQQNQMCMESDVGSQQITVDQDKISDNVENTEAIPEEDKSVRVAEESSERTTINLDLTNTIPDNVSVGKENATDVVMTDSVPSSKELVNSNESNSPENITDTSRNLDLIPEKSAGGIESSATGQRSPIDDQATREDILECDISDTEMEDLSEANSRNSLAEAMVIDDDIVEIEDPFSWKNVKVDKTSARTGKGAQKRTLVDSNGWRIYKESLSDTPTPEKKPRLPDDTGSPKQSGIEVIDISEDSCVKRLSVVQPKKEIEVVDLDGSGSSESEDDTESEASVERKPNIFTETETKPPKILSAIDRAKDLKRKQILDSFPSMNDRAALTVSVPNRQFLPPNINPVQAAYTIQRRNLARECNTSSRPQTFSRFSNRNFYNSPRFNNFLNAGGQRNHPRHFNPQSHHHPNPHRQLQPLHARFNSPGPHPMWPRAPLLQAPNNLPINPMQAFQMITSILLPMFGISPNCNPFSGQPLMIPNENQHWNQNMMWQQPPRRNYTPWQNSPPWRFQSRSQQWGNNRPNRPWQSRHERPNFERDQEEMPERPKRPALLNTPRPATSWTDTRITSDNFQTETRRPKRPFEFRSNFRVNRPRDFLTDIEDEIQWKKIEEAGSESSDSECSEEITITPVQRPVQESQSELRPLLQLDQCVDSASIMASLQVITNADISEFASAEHSRCLKISFDMYQPNAPFKKSHPPKPSFRLCVMGIGEAVPSPGEIALLLSGIHDDVPLIFALVHPDDVSFYHYSGVEIPKQVFFS